MPDTTDPQPGRPNDDLDRLTDADLDEIAARAGHLFEYVTMPSEADQLAGVDVPALIDEVRRLRATPAALPSIHANDVEGFCPACGHGVLMLGDGGHVVCTLMDCPRPEAADELLRNAAAPSAPADRAGLRDRIADAVVPLLLDTLPKVIARSRGYEIADAVLSVLPPDGRAGVLREAEAHLRARAAELVAAADADPLAEVKRGTDARRHSAECWNAAAEELRRLAAGERDEQQAQQVDATILAELQQHLTEHTPSCNARTDHLMRRAAWALGMPRPAHVGGNAEDCPGCEGTNPPYPFICPGPDAAAPVVGQPPADTMGEEAQS